MLEKNKYKIKKKTLTTSEGAGFDGYILAYLKIIIKHIRKKN